MLELASRANGQFRRSTSPPDRPFLNRRAQHGYGHWSRQRRTADGLEESRTREGLKIRFGEICQSRSWHPWNDRSGHLKVRRDRRGRHPVNMPFWGRRSTPGSRHWHSQTTNRYRSRRRWGLLFDSNTSFLPQKQREAWSGLVRSRHVLETQPSGNFVQRRESLAALEGENRTDRFRLDSGFREPEFDLFSPWI